MKAGIDICENYRIKDAIDNTNGFLQRVYSADEIKEIMKKKAYWQTAAGKFAAKEAFIKASGHTNANLSSIEILKDELNKPYIFFNGVRHSAIVSISHERKYAVAMVIINE
jgi:holo-[acyl-carrier protein] synthase